MKVTALAWEIDSPSPALSLPFIRERRIWGDVINKDYECSWGVRDTASPVWTPAAQRAAGWGQFAVHLPGEGCPHDRDMRLRSGPSPGLR